MAKAQHSTISTDACRNNDPLEPLMRFPPVFLPPPVLNDPGRQVNGSAPRFGAMILPDRRPFQDPDTLLATDSAAEPGHVQRKFGIDFNPNLDVILPQTAVVILAFSIRDTALSVLFLSQKPAYSPAPAHEAVLRNSQL